MTFRSRFIGNENRWQLRGSAFSGICQSERKKSSHGAVFHLRGERYGGGQCIHPAADTGESAENRNILIGAEEYVLKNGDATELLGNTISFYYRQKRGQELPELLYAESVGHSERLELEGKDILSAGNSGLTYQGESRVQTARFSSYAAVIKNGKMVPFSADDFMPENGTLTLIDNDGDGYYDVLKVMDYETYVVLETGDSGYEVTTRSGVTLSFDPEEQGCDIVIIKNGAAASYDQLAAGDVISYAASSGAGRNLKTALVSSETVSGDIQEIDDEGITVEETIMRR